MLNVRSIPQVNRSAKLHAPAYRIALALSAGLLAATLAPAAFAGDDHRAQIYQLDTRFDGEFTENSGWGFLELQYIGAADILYFNAVIGGSWQLENIPVLSADGPGVEHLEYLAFDLGVRHGEEVQFIDTATSLTPFPLNQPPRDIEVVEVFSAPYEIDTGILGDTLRVGAPGPMSGGNVQDAAKGKGDYINQDCGKDECVPAAVSNVLKYLNQKFELGIDDALITIEALKEPLEWQPRRGERPGGCHGDNWPGLKARYLEDKKMRVSSEKVEPGGNAAEAAKVMKKLMRALKKGCLIEINVEGHCAMLTGIAPIEGTDEYKLEIQHDINQGPAGNGGTVTQSVTYDAGGRDVDEGWLMEGKKVKNFVIQCPKKGGRRRGGDDR